jgi:hypothetical protein
LNVYETFSESAVHSDSSTEDILSLSQSAVNNDRKINYNCTRTVAQIVKSNHGQI